jgi:putative heme-binding domain-containing protein
MKQSRFVAKAALVVALSAVASVAAGQSADIGAGKTLFDGLCARCHGIGGTGGEGPNLDRPRDEQVLRTAIRDGLPDRGMPRVRRVTESEMEQLVAYIRSLSRTTSVARSGNAQRGRDLYGKLGCGSCHIIDGQGTGLGPELTQIGLRRGPEHLRNSILDPVAALPQGSLAIPARGFAEFLPVLVITRDGQEVRGLRVNEDSFTIQLRDGGNKYHSFRKSDVKHVEKEFGKTLMPSYKARLAAADIDDLVAYLSSLGGAR